MLATVLLPAAGQTERAGELDEWTDRRGADRKWGRKEENGVYKALRGLRLVLGKGFGQSQLYF